MPSRVRRSRKLPFELKTSKANQGRIHSNDEFYNSYKWRKYSLRFREVNRICGECKTVIVDIKESVTDHIIPINLGGSHYDARNHQALHRWCHNSKSGRERHGHVEAWVLNSDGEKIPKRNAGKETAQGGVNP